MKHRKLARTFRDILLRSIPLPVGVALAACSTDSSAGGSDAGTGAGGKSASSGGSGNGGRAAGGSGAAGHAGNGSGGGSAAGGSGAGGASGGSAGESDAGDAGPDATALTSCGERVPITPTGPLFCVPPVCFPIEAGAAASDAGDSGAELFDRTECIRLCGTGNWFSCSRTEVSGVPMIRCNHDCTGRRPSGLCPSELSGGPELGSYFAEMARLETASVFAFRELRVELRAHGAPRALVRAAERAARDEIRHARATRALARRYGGDVRSPLVERKPVRSLEAIALDNAVEGCVRETFGALVAHHQARAAQDPVVAATMARIARDETRHAALAHDIDAWAKRRLGRLARRRVDAAKREGYGALLSRKIPDAADPILGLPGASAGRVLIEQLMAALPAYGELLRSIDEQA